MASGPRHLADTPRVSEELRALVVERARERSEYCLSPASYATQRLSVEHVLPRAKGGQTALENLALVCQAATTTSTTAPRQLTR